jgi:hypothetical protein
MAQPTKSDIHVDRPLTNISIAYIQRAEDFIASKVFPIVPVMKQSDKYFIYSRESWFRSDAQLRGPGTISAGSGFELTTATYSADVYAIHKDVSDQVRANADAPIQLDRNATEYVTQQLLLKRELTWAEAFFTTGLWTGASTGTDLVGGTDFTVWDDVSSTPINDITEQADAMAKKTGFRPNTLVLGPEVYTQLKNHPDVLDRVKYTQRGVVTEEILASLFDVRRVMVARAIKITTNEGATATYAYVHGKNALLCYVAPAAGLMVPTAGYTFTWQGLFGAGRDGMRVKNFRLEERESDRIEGELSYDQKVVGADLGVFFSAAVS